MPRGNGMGCAAHRNTSRGLATGLRQAVGRPNHLLHNAMSQSHRAQSEYAHCHPCIHSPPSPPLPLVYEQHPTFVSLASMSTCQLHPPTPKGPSASNQTTHAMHAAGAPASCLAHHKNTQQGSCPQRRQSAGQARHVGDALLGSTVKSPARRCISSGRYTVLYDAATAAASGSTLRAGGARGIQSWGPHSGFRAMCGS